MTYEKDYVYMYGQIMSTYAYLLSGVFPEADGYAEIARKCHIVGGETGTAAAVLCSLGAPIKLGGTHLGRANAALITDYFADKCADISELEYEDFEGVSDYVIIDKIPAPASANGKSFIRAASLFMSRPAKTR